MPLPWQNLRETLKEASDKLELLGARPMLMAVLRSGTSTSAACGL
jgi:hypothetical protein